MFIRSAVEQSSVVWSSSITQDELNSLERTQKVALKIIYKEDYNSYENALKMAKLTTLKTRYQKLQLNFALKCVKNKTTKHMFPPQKPKEWARYQEKYRVPFARKERYFRSSIPTMARMLNLNAKCSN